ncbi:MAG: ribonuclease III [Candidatus Chisholmbacteria bacterium]|nr:ribonuclease III [Candidatus Chisholmbacteria bacterium]
MTLHHLFHQPELLTLALTHRSYLNEHPKVSQSNERLEFLGDAVLELITSQYLFENFPHHSEGQLTAIRAALVKTTTLAQVAQTLELGNHLRLSHGEDQSGGRSNPALLANTLEAVIGALFLDQGLTAAQNFVTTHLLPLLPAIINRQLYQDPKSLLQEKAQARGFPPPVYKVTTATGPDHRKEFIVQVIINHRVSGQGTGKTKQAGEAAAAQAALVKFEKK